MGSIQQDLEGLAFTKPAETHEFSGLLFDMDGTIIDSTAAIIKHWHAIGEELGVDPNVILATSHGRRSIDVLKLYDPKLATWEYVSSKESQIPKLYGHSAIEIPGSRTLLDHISANSIPWAIVTSGTRPLVTGWLNVMSLASPANLVTAEDVRDGKPDPACYLLGAEKLELKTVGGKGGRILVLEDAPAGVKAGKTAGFEVVGLATTHGVEELRQAGADWIVRDMRSVRFVGWDREKVGIEIVDALEG
ncbi:HAD-like protein [Aulographum hederae CBS 113979]|uniref:HAD-like protein n=1 Tax=Aulographum hederae CBS 113979 TaxID=1176131 RepID=A0A6G1H921_9PEZI|nr:HAD-like protein [Aulographum hederae CBS 113979]